MPPTRRQMMAATGVLLTSALMASINNSVVNVAFPVMAAAFRVPAASIAWVSIVYTLTNASLVTIYGRLSDMTGRKRLFAIGIVAFAVTSALCGTSQNLTVMIGWRIAQGAGGALLTANSLAYLVELYPRDRRGAVVGMWEAVIGTGQAVGPILGGFLLGAFDWPSIFFVNLPFAALILALIPRFMVETKARVQRQVFDFTGAFFFAAGVAGVLYALTQAYALGWGSPLIIGCLTAGALAVAAFVLTEQRVRMPMIDLRMFRSWTFSAGNLAKVFAYLPLAGNTFLLPFYMEQALKLTPETLGLSLTPLPVGMLVTASTLGPLSDRIGTRKVAPAGLLVMGLGAVLLVFAEPDRGLAVVLVGAALAGIGIGAFVAPNDSSILSVTPSDKLGVASGIMGVSRSLGMILGISLSAGLLSARLAVNGNAFVPSFHQVYAVLAVVAFGGIAFALVRDRQRPDKTGQAQAI